MNNKIIILAAVGGISVATGASALPLSSFQSDKLVGRKRIRVTWLLASKAVASICTMAICTIQQRVATMIAIVAGG
jgi:hypothetical protein